MRQVPAVAEVHAENGVARLEEGEIDGDVRLRAGMRLNIGVLRAEELLGPLDGERLDLVDILAAAVIARAGIALGILVGQVTSHGLKHSLTDKVLRGDQLDMVPLALQFTHHALIDLHVLLFDSLVAHGHVLRIYKY